MATEDRFGYSIKGTSNIGNQNGIHLWGFSEGDQAIEHFVVKGGIKLVPTQMLKAAVGGGMGVSAAFLAAGTVGDAIGGAVAAMFGAGFVAMLKNQAMLGFAQGASLTVTLTGDFEASYKIENGKDLDALPGFLAVVPSKFDFDGKPYRLGKTVIKDLCTNQAHLVGKKASTVEYRIDV
jgi:hypothetical protein